MSILLAAALCLAPITHDGDSIRCGTERIRLANIDAPELAGSPRCSPQRVRQLASTPNPSWCDYRRGEAARKALAAFLASGPVMVQRVGVDRYRRTLARVSVDGRDAGEYLIGLGLARGWR